MAIQIFALGDAAATFVFGEDRAHELALGFCARLAQRKPQGVIEWAPAFASVTVWYDPDLVAFDALQAALAPLAGEGSRETVAGARFAIPFCRDADLAPDLEEIAALKNLSPDAYIAQFAAQVFDVAMLGFQPGFAYLSGLPESLDVPRLASPRKKVPARSLAVADGMCAAYPFESPGGWRLVGRTPAPLFDPRNPERPAVLTPGDKVRWRPVAREDFDRLEREWAEGGFSADLLSETA